MSIIDRLNHFGEILDKYFNADLRFAQKIYQRASPNIPILRRMNETLDKYRGLISLFIIIYMFSLLYIFKWYADGVLLMATGFIEAKERCEANASDPTDFRTSTFTKTFCFNESIYAGAYDRRRTYFEGYGVWIPMFINFSELMNSNWTSNISR